MKIGVFCGSKSSNNSDKDLAFRLGKEIIRRGHELVYGGGTTGLMGELIKGALENRIKLLGEITGIVCPSVLKWTTRSPYVLIIEVPNLQRRKEEFLKRADYFIALPGGIGTLNEITEVMASNVLEVEKKLVILDPNNYYRKFLEFLNPYVPLVFSNINLVFNNIEEVINGSDLKE